MSAAFEKTWFLHWLAASGGLETLRHRIVPEMHEAFKMLRRFTPPPRLDILLDRSKHTIPELGLLGKAHHGSLFSLLCDPENPALEQSLTGGAIRRQVLHEVHHCLRMAGPGYGWTLGEALISEGLAGHFVNHLADTPPELWESAIDRESLERYCPTAAALKSTGYGHAEWFFGTGELPRWLGYSLGFELVRLWRETARPETREEWIDTPAAEILAAGMNAGLIRT